MSRTCLLWENAKKKKQAPWCSGHTYCTPTGRGCCTTCWRRCSRIHRKHRIRKLIKNTTYRTFLLDQRIDGFIQFERCGHSRHSVREFIVLVPEMSVSPTDGQHSMQKPGLGESQQSISAKKIPRRLSRIDGHPLCSRRPLTS